MLSQIHELKKVVVEIPCSSAMGGYGFFPKENLWKKN